jgi:hypothetical protein
VVGIVVVVVVMVGIVATAAVVVVGIAVVVVVMVGIAVAVVVVVVTVVVAAEVVVAVEVVVAITITSMTAAITKTTKRTGIAIVIIVGARVATVLKIGMPKVANVARETTAMVGLVAITVVSVGYMNEEKRTRIALVVMADVSAENAVINIIPAMTIKSNKAPPNKVTGRKREKANSNISVSITVVEVIVGEKSEVLTASNVTNTVGAVNVNSINSV